ncbi:CRISPR-associated protein, Cas2 (plasmid) [Euzebya pacifica]|uniref:CRISPR-associated protein, Cas2 n=1 Tax=Euzebya pacifica TaxID=1608957 RepID=A0A346Y612_9ACTN|nr:type I-E CRISPR-associated endoribonuclease Cas2e [Euzebya pacifica]AXV09909.1 CRISPR-associated protein, Cas2 [Euzebya pacifica]
MQAVLHATAIPDHLRGYVSRLLQEVHTGLYIGIVTPKVADGLWDAVTTYAKEGTATLITTTNANEFGFDVRLHNSSTHRMTDFDGLQLPTERS